MPAPAKVYLMPISNVVTPEEVLALSPTGEIFTCDFYVKGAEQWDATPWGFRSGRLTNIDHHAPVPRMAYPISSANLALLRVQALGPACPEDSVVINHTDCDSVLSSVIIAGLIAPDAQFCAAAIAADHTGAPNPIADLLQALDELRDYKLSLDNLRLLLTHQPLESVAQERLTCRLQKREAAAALVQQGDYKQVGGLFYATPPEAIDGEFFPALLPEAVVILLASPRPGETGRWNIKLRLGRAAPAGFALDQLNLKEFDAGYGGRWNAGSNKRGEGTSAGGGGFEFIGAEFGKDRQGEDFP